MAVTISVTPGSSLAALLSNNPDLAHVWSSFVATIVAYSGQVVALAVLAAFGLVLFYFVGLLAIHLGGRLANRAAKVLTAPLRRLGEAIRKNLGFVAGKIGDAGASWATLAELLPGSWGKRARPLWAKLRQSLISSVAN